MTTTVKEIAKAEAALKAARELADAMSLPDARNEALRVVASLEKIYADLLFDSL